MHSGAVYYAKQNHTYILRFEGDVRYTLGCAVDDFLDALFTRTDFDRIIIDLRAAESIDSTSLGLLAKVANFERTRFGHKTTIVSTQSDVNATLRSVGFDKVFDLCIDRDGCALANEPLPVDEPTRAHLNQTMLDAHRILSDLNPSNRETFKSVVEMLERSKS